MSIYLDRSVTGDFGRSIRCEWLETNGLGGWASSTVSGAHTRRYHGLLVAAMQPPAGRFVLLSRLDEVIETGGDRFELGCNIYPGAVHPRGYEYVQGFSRDLFPVFEYGISGIRLRKSILAVHGENTILLMYEIMAANEAFDLELHPLVAGRDCRHLMQTNDAIQPEASFSEGTFHVRPYPDIPDLFIHILEASYKPQPHWYFNVEYREEQAQGLDFREDLFHYGVFTLRVKEGDSIPVILSTQNLRERDPYKIAARERNRRLRLIARTPRQDDFSKNLTLAADQFVVQRGGNWRTIIAGYPWFTDWGRDAMIALPGITLVTRRFRDAKKILRAFAGNISEGMIPNHFPEDGTEPEYNTADASLWFFVAVYKYLQYTGDTGFVLNELKPVLAEIIRWHDRGTRYNIHMDSDGLLYAGMPGMQLTWMDAKVGDRVVTPRQGKAVEINALWYNVLRIFADLCMQCNEKTDALSFANQAERARRRFNEIFWNEETGCLYDYVDGEYRDAAIRPNQIFALSLPFPLLSHKHAGSVLQVVEEKLLTPRGLRSLCPGHPEYQPLYGGDQRSRDAAYHQGTVWAWLLGPYITALIRVKGARGKSQAAMIIENLMPHLQEAGIGSISEIFDADPPHAPHGCIAQAWSVAEIARAYAEDVLGFPE